MTLVQLRTDEDIFKHQDGESLVTLQVTNLPDNTFEPPLKEAIEKVVPVAAVHVPVCLLTRKIYSHGYLVLRRKHAEVLLQRRSISFCGCQLNFNDEAPAKDLVEYMIKTKQHHSTYVAMWADDVRPGHPDYKLLPVREEMFDLEPAEPGRPTAHTLVDDVLLMIFKKFKVCDLLRMERTCRRWQWNVRRILGGHEFVNFGDVHSLWGDFEHSDMYYAHSMMVEKVFILNGQTLEHLIINNMFIDADKVRRAAKQCCPKLTHYFDVTRLRTCHTYQAIFEPINDASNHASHVHAEFRKSGETIKFDNYNHLTPKCPCASAIDADIIEEANWAREDLVDSFLE